MSLSVSSSLSIAAFAAANPSPASAAAPSKQQTTNEPVDTVKLSESQQVYQLYNQGHTVPQIATSLSLSESAVNLYLGISGTTG